MKYILIILISVGNFVLAAPKTYVSGNWNTGVWSPIGAPGPTDDVIINSGSPSIPLGYSAVCASLTINGGNLTSFSATAIAISGNFSMTAGTITLGSAAATIVPFPSVTGTISLTGGTVSYASASNSQIISTIPSYFILNINRNSKSISSTLNVASNLTFTTSATLTTSANINVAGSISGAGTLSLGSGVTLDVQGSVSVSTLTCSATSTVNYSGSSGNQTGKVTTYGTLIKNGGANSLLFSNGFSAVTMQVLTGTTSISGGTTCTLTNTLEVANGAGLTLSADFPTGYSTLILGTSSTITYTGDGNIASLSYGNLTIDDINGFTASRVGTGNTTVQGNLTISASDAVTLTLPSSPDVFEVLGNITGGALSTIDATNGYLKMGGTLTSTVVLTTSNSTIEYASSSPTTQTIRSQSFYDLVLSGTGNKTFVTGTVQIENNLTSTTTGTITYSASNVVEFNSSTPGQVIPAFTYNMLLVTNSDKTLGGDIIVSRNVTGALNLDGAKITTGLNNIRVLGTSTTAITQTTPSTDYIIGNLSRNFTNGLTLAYPLGDVTGALNLQVLMSGLTVGSGTNIGSGYLTVTSTIGDPTTYPLFSGANFSSTTSACNRYWTISNSGLTFTSIRAGLKFFNPADLGSPSLDPLNFLCRVKKSGIWSDGTLPNIISDSATVSGLTLTTGNSMDIWLGEKNITYCESQVASGDWQTISTWSCGKVPTNADTAVIKTGHIITLNSPLNTARYLKIDGTAELSTTAIVGNIGNRGILISPTGSITRTSGTPTLSSTGNVEINNSTTIPTNVVLAMGGTDDTLKTNQTTLSIPRLTINTTRINNSVPNLTVGTDLSASATTNVLKQASGTVLTLSDASTNITLDASATNAEVIYNRGASQTINRGTYYKLTLTSNTAAAKVTTFPGGTTSTIVTNELKLQTGSASSHALNITLSTTTLTGTGALFTMNANTALNLGDITLATAISFPSTFSSYAFDATSIVNYNSNGVQTVSGTPAYQNLNITTGATNSTKTLGGTASVALALTINNGSGNATLSLGTNTLNIAGTISGTGTLLTPVGSTVNYNASSGSQPILAQQYANLSFSNAATKTLPTSGVLVSGNLTSNSSLSIPTNSILILNGTSGNQVINTPLSFYNLYKTGAAMVSFSTSNTTVTNLFSVKDGSGLISPNSFLTIANGASLFDSSSTTSSFAVGSAGNVNILKTASGINKSYLLTGPVSSYTSTTLDAGQGKTVLRFDSDGTPLDVATVYKNSCSAALKQNGSINGLYKATTGSLEVGRGYSVLQASAKTLAFLGNPNFGNVTFSPITTVNRQIPVSGFNWCAGSNGLAILGNPYPTAIDWNLVWISSSNLNTSVKVWNGINYTDISKDDAVLANRAIKSGQGFIVQVSDFTTNLLTFQNSHRIIDNNGSLLRTESNENLKIELTDTQNEEFKDILTINFNEKATDGFDPQFDSYDLPGISDVPSLVAVVNGNELSTSEFPTPIENKSLPVLMSFKNESQYEVKVSNPTSLSGNLKAYLVDKTKKIEYDLSEKAVMPFKKGIFDNFEVQLRTSDAQTQYTTAPSNNNKVYSLYDKIVIENNNDNFSDITICDVTGKLITTRNAISKGKYEIEINAKTQMYIVKLSSNATTNTYKVILY